jgi:two-component system chemotaxis response regulator CheB
VIGVSTGGPAALGKLLPSLAASFPVPVLIVQHMPKLFTLALAERLDHLCALRVREAYDGASVAPGAIWMAPGDAHMEVGHAGTGDSGLLNAPYGSAGPGLPAFVRLHQQRPLNHCRPSVDYLFSSAARMYGAGTLALIMTGMGSDGLSGARCVHQAGGTVLTQDEATSAVWGMPGRVVREGLAHAIIPLHALAEELTARVHSGRSTPSSGPAPVTPERRSLAWDADVEGIHGLL